MTEIFVLLTQIKHSHASPNKDDTPKIHDKYFATMDKAIDKAKDVINDHYSDHVPANSAITDIYLHFDTHKGEEEWTEHGNERFTTSDNHVYWVTWGVQFCNDMCTIGLRDSYGDDTPYYRTIYLSIKKLSVAI